MVHYKRRWSVIYEEDVSSACEWCQINLHTSRDVSAPLNQLPPTFLYFIPGTCYFGYIYLNIMHKTKIP